MAALDLHVVVKSITPQFETELLSWGLSSKEVVGGDSRVRMDKLFSIKFETKEHADETYDKIIAAIQQQSHFVGYVEEEIVTDDTTIAVTPGASSTPPPFGENLRVSNGPPGRHKGCDIHASMVAPPLALTEQLLAAGFYYLVLRKPDLGDVTIFTVQTESVPEGRRLQDILIEYLRTSGVFAGMVKFEVTRAIQDFGFGLPPIILTEHSKVGSA